jgi:nonsense-mediated mRNA decay protein 3
MKNSGYRQAILQLRTRFNEKILKEIERIVKNEKKDFYSFISRIEEKKEGIDVFLGSKNVAYKILKFLEKNYKIEYKISKKLVGMKKGKRVYLHTISIKNGN